MPTNLGTQPENNFPSIASLYGNLFSTLQNKKLQDDAIKLEREKFDYQKKQSDQQRLDALKENALSKAKMEQIRLEATAEPTITAPGMIASGGSIGNYKVPITSLPGQVSGGTAEQYNNQVSAGLRQTGQEMTQMGIAAANDNARGGSSGEGQSANPSLADFIMNYYKQYGAAPDIYSTPKKK